MHQDSGFNYKARNKVYQEGLITDHGKASFILTQEGEQVVDSGGYRNYKFKEKRIEELKEKHLRNQIKLQELEIWFRKRWFWMMLLTALITAILAWIF